eukprot:2706458-Heterocapsa_arctica.AAC.1
MMRVANTARTLPDQATMKDFTVAQAGGSDFGEMDDVSPRYNLKVFPGSATWQSGSGPQQYA